MPYWVPPWPRRHLDPVKPADVIVYRDGDYAVAVDRHGGVIARSTDHAEAIQHAIENMKSGRISVISDLVFEKR